MGYNLSICCHSHKYRIDILRGYEPEAIRGFFIEHLNCYILNNKLLEVGIDNNSNEPEWMKDGYYASEVFPPTNSVKGLAFENRFKYSKDDRIFIPLSSPADE
jgi:hypothetical protein